MKIFILLMISIALGFGMNEKIEGLYSDKQVKSIGKAALGGEIAIEGTLSFLSKKNSLIAGANFENFRVQQGKPLSTVQGFESLDALLSKFKISKERLVEIEGVSVNGWGVHRYRISESFDLVVEATVVDSKKGQNFKVSCLFLIPHNNEKYGINLNSPKRWEKIMFSHKQKN